MYDKEFSFANGGKKKRGKYGAQKVTTADGETYDSEKEHRRGQQLKELTSSGKIKNLHRQVKYELIPAQRDKDGKLIERSCSYVADFVYQDENGDVIVEDTKGLKTAEYIIKRKLMLSKYGIRVVET